MHRGLLVGLVPLVVGLLAACSDDALPPVATEAVTMAPTAEASMPAANTPAATAPGAASGEPVITAAVFQFAPASLEVTVGTTVRWENTDQILHTATAGEPDALTGVFDGQLDGVGSSFEFTFQEPGQYSFFCSRHLHMRGEVVVR